MMAQDSKRIAKNTFFLYFRSIIIMAVSIYTSRVLLQTLGVDDFGIYNVVGGFVGMFSILSSSLVNASQRFISYEMGKLNPQMLKVFCGTFSIHIILAVIILILFESFGLWFLNEYLNISSDRINAANWVFQCSVITFCIHLITVPFNASIIAHEKMSAFAIISIYEAIAKLIIVFLLWLTGFDKLIVFAVLMLIISFSLFCLYAFYCFRYFSECRFKFLIDKTLCKSLLSFSGWNFLGSTATVLVTQGVNMLTNIFFGVALNATRGIAEQVNNAINQFVNNFMMAMNPQITQSYAAENYSYMNTLLIRGAKYATILYWFMSLAIFIKAEFILDVWLVEVPPYAPVFLRLVIIFTIFQSLSNTLYIGVLATGKIKKYQIVMSSLYIGSFVLCYIFFKIGLGPEYGYISTIIAVFMGLFARLFMLRSIIPSFDVKKYVCDAIFKSSIVIVLSTTSTWLVSKMILFNSLLNFLVVLFFSIASIAFSTYFLALDGSEKSLVKNCIAKAKLIISTKIH